MTEEKIKLKIESLQKKVNKLEKEVNKLKNIPACPRCKSKKIIKHGTRRTDRGVAQRYYCKNCNWKFSKKDMGYRMRNDAREIRKALSLRKKGYTLSQISDIIGGVSRQTILRWLKKYYKTSRNKEIIRTMKSRRGGNYKRGFIIKI